jgi:8-oxo-dGTP diphosphatase
MPDDNLPQPNQPVPAVGVVCFNDAGEVLLIQRGTPPRLGEWSIPGGRLEWGETAKAGALRELHEETGVEAEIIGLIDVVDAIFTSRTTAAVTRHYVLIDYVARHVSGTPLAGDDAAQARFVAQPDLESYNLWDETMAVITKGRAMLGLQNDPK